MQLPGPNWPLSGGLGGLWPIWWPRIRAAWSELVDGTQPLEQYFDQLLSEQHVADEHSTWSWDEDNEAVSLLEQSVELHRTARLNDAARPRGGVPHATLADAVANEEYCEAAKIKADMETIYAELEDTMCSCRGVCTCAHVDHTLT